MFRTYRLPQPRVRAVARRIASTGSACDWRVKILPGESSTEITGFVYHREQLIR
jgi:hypothetical protein